MSGPYSTMNADLARRAGEPIAGRPTMLISGGSGGLGRELVRHFSAQHNVVFGFRESVRDAESLFEEIRGARNWALPVQVDVTHAGQVEQLREKVSGLCGGLDVFVHTTGHFSMTKFHNMDVETWNAEIDSTVNAAFYLWKSFSHLLTASERGRVIFIGDSAAEHLRAKRESTAYYIGKHGLVLLARTIASEHQGTGLTCNVVSPGVLPNSVDLDEPGMKVNVQFDEIAGVMEFLLSSAGDAVSGSNIVASGGWNV